MPLHIMIGQVNSGSSWLFMYKTEGVNSTVVYRHMNCFLYVAGLLLTFAYGMYICLKNHMCSIHNPGTHFSKPVTYEYCFINITA